VEFLGTPKAHRALLIGPGDFKVICQSQAYNPPTCWRPAQAQNLRGLGAGLLTDQGRGPAWPWEAICLGGAGMGHSGNSFLTSSPSGSAGQSSWCTHVNVLCLLKRKACLSFLALSLCQACTVSEKLKSSLVYLLLQVPF
jgi:hypothetical protein